MKSSTLAASKKPSTKGVTRTRPHAETTIKNRTKTVTRTPPVITKTKPVSKGTAVRVSPSQLRTRTQASRQKKQPLSSIGRSTKRYGKVALKGMLLSPVFHSAFKIVTGLAISGSMLYGSYAFMGKLLAHDVVVSKSEIVSRIAKLTPVPEEVPDAVVRVQDPETLKKQNIFYNRVKEGDYIVMYPKIAIIYDLRNNEIVAVKKTESR
jgi:hypothetical protein